MTTATIDDHSWDLAHLDFYHLPFDSDLPRDIFASIQDQEDDRSDFSTAVLTPSLSGTSAVEEHFSFEPLHEPDLIVTDTNALLGTGAGQSFTAGNWATPPASPPPTTSTELAHATHYSRFAAAFKPDLLQAYSTPSVSSAEDESEEWSNVQELLGASTPKRRRSSTGAGKSCRSNTKGAIAAALTMMTPRRGSPVPPSCPLSSDEMDDPENKRRSHNVLERKRRNDLKKSYQELRMQLPNLAENARAPTGHILTNAVEYIETLKSEEALLLRTITELRRRNARSTQLLRSMKC